MQPEDAMPRADMLVIDDEESILLLLSDYFSARSFEVDQAQDLETAKKLILRKKYDVIVADLRLSGSDRTEGLELIDYVRSASPLTPVLLLTAYGTPELVAEARRRGAAEVLQKPQSLSRIAAAVSSCLERSGM